MASSLPVFASFSVHEDEKSAGTRWKKWLDRFENLLCALDINDDRKKKAMLLHYVGEETYDIFDSFTDEQKGIGAVRAGDREDEQEPDEYNVAKKSLTDFFTPKKNTTYEMFQFRQASQNHGESIDSFYTRLRKLASTCEFHDVDKEILSQILQGCLSTRLRRKALKDNYSLTQVLDEARAIELSESRASVMEKKNVNAVSSRSNDNKFKAAKHVDSSCVYGASAGAGYSSSNPRRGQGRGRGSATNHGGNFTKFRKGQNNSANHGSFYASSYHGDCSSTNINNMCRYCGGLSSHTSCPARGKECRRCHKMNHFARVCHFKTKVRQIDFFEREREPESSESSEESLFNITNRQISKTPAVMANIMKTQVNFLIDTGASVNVLNGTVYDKLCVKPKLQNPCPLIFAYGSDEPLPVRGFFRADISYKNSHVDAGFYVIDASGSQSQSHNLLSADTAQALNIVHFAFSSSVMSTIPDQFPSLFDEGMGKIEGQTVKLHIDTSVHPVSQRHRRIPFHVRKDVETELERLEKLDVIEKVKGPTPWVSPVVIVPKKTKGVRVCIDMREANKAIGREKHPMPTVDDLIADLNSSTVFSKLDLTNAYHQLELEESSRYITTFTTHVGLRRYKRLLFGVNAASEIFQKIISDLLSDIPGARNLSDDIIIHGKNQADHDKSLKKTLQRLQEKGAKLNKEKCIFSVNKLTFFGHVFSDKGVSADPEKVKTIINTEPLKNVGQVRSFLGMTQYVARFIPQYATLTEPLRRLTKQDAVWKWTEVEQQAFDKLKQTLTGANVMAYFDSEKPTEIIVDASPVGLGAIFTQNGKIISYASRALTDVEQRYSQTDREMLAVVYGVEHFHLYLFGSTFTVVTDHKPLLGIWKSQKPATARIERWRLRLMPYEFDLQYRPGRNEQNPADFISRNPHTQPKRDNAAEAYIRYVTKNAVPKAMTFEEVQKATQDDPQLQKLMTAIQYNNWKDPELSSFSRFKEELSISDGVILRDHRLVIPSALQQKVIDIAHHTHQGIVKTKQLIREKVWFPNIDKLVDETVQKCIPCQSSYPGSVKREPLCPTPLPAEPWSEIAVDFAGPFPSGHYVLVAIDEHSRYPEVEVIPSTAARVVIPCLNLIFARQGFPSVIKTDNGPPFQSHEFHDFAEQSGFQHRKITPLWPEANGEAERFMKTLNKFVRATTTEDQNWRTQLPNFLRQYRATPHSSTNISPFEALNGRKMNIGLPAAPKKNPTHNSSLTRNDAISKKKMKEYADKRRGTKPSLIKPGDSVLVRQHKTNKLTPPYDPHPYTVVRKSGSMVTAERGGRHITRNSSFFKPLHVDNFPEEDEDDDNDDDVDFSTSQPVTNTQNSTTVQNQEAPPRSEVTPTSINNSPRSSQTAFPSPNHQNKQSCVPSSSQETPRRYPQRSTVIPKRFSDFIMT